MGLRAQGLGLRASGKVHGFSFFFVSCGEGIKDLRTGEIEGCYGYRVLKGGGFMGVDT